MRVPPRRCGTRGLVDIAVAIAIGAVALLYASVGQAGATGYISVLALAGVAPHSIKAASLCLNITVAAIATLRFSAASPAAQRTFFRFAVLGIPASILGGMLNLPSAIFRPVVGALLFCAGGYMAWSARPRRIRLTDDTDTPMGEALAVGAAVGLASGVIGIGGGILLAPWLLFRRRVSALTAGGVAALFNLFNSAAGALGAWSLVLRLPPTFLWWLLAAICGGWVGATLGSRHLPGSTLRLVMSVLLVVAGVKLLLS